MITVELAATAFLLAIMLLAAAKLGMFAVEIIRALIEKRRRRQ